MADLPQWRDSLQQLVEEADSVIDATPNDTDQTDTEVTRPDLETCLRRSPGCEGDSHRHVKCRDIVHSVS